ncbi:hypothetical protein Dimus_016720 [Dionaea muscipula]
MVGVYLLLSHLHRYLNGGPWKFAHISLRRGREANQAPTDDDRNWFHFRFIFLNLQFIFLNLDFIFLTLALGFLNLDFIFLNLALGLVILEFAISPSISTPSSRFSSSSSCDY